MVIRNLYGGNMDTGEGRFEMVDTLEEAIEKQKGYPLHGGIFKIGEILEIKGSQFKIQSINPKGMRPKLLKRHV